MPIRRTAALAVFSPDLPGDLGGPPRVHLRVDFTRLQIAMAEDRPGRVQAERLPDRRGARVPQLVRRKPGDLHLVADVADCAVIAGRRVVRSDAPARLPWLRTACPPTRAEQ